MNRFIVSYLTGIIHYFPIEENVIPWSESLLLEIKKRNNKGIFMKAVILAGGFGTRISEETQLKPKPMIEIGGKPILWHIMKIFSHYNVNEFIICCGYKGYIIKEYFANYFLHMSDVTFDMAKNEMKVHHQNVEPWTVTLLDTGENTMTGGRLKLVYPFIKNENHFILHMEMGCQMLI